MTAKSVLCQKVHFLWASVRVSRIADYIQTTWDMGSTISIQQTTNNWHKLCHWQHSNSTFSPPAVHVPSPSPHGCVAPHNVVYILSLYPLPYVSIIGRIDVVRCMIGPLSPLPSIWQLCLAPDIIEEAGHYPAPQCPHIIIMYWSPPSHSYQGWSRQCSSSQSADIRFLSRGERRGPPPLWWR